MGKEKLKYLRRDIDMKYLILCIGLVLSLHTQAVWTYEDDVVSFFEGGVNKVMFTKGYQSVYVGIHSETEPYEFSEHWINFNVGFSYECRVSGIITASDGFIYLCSMDYYPVFHHLITRAKTNVTLYEDNTVIESVDMYMQGNQLRELLK